MTEVMTANELMGGGPEEPMPTKKGKAIGRGVAEDPMLWGVPGHLTQEETEVFFQFKEILATKSDEFKNTIYSFGEIEGEAWALCRWLRARKFVLDDVIAMIEEATKVRADAKAHDFYPDPVDALGCTSNLFFAQYPQLYPCVTKKGVPVFISKPGILNVDGMECITTLDGIIKFHWHVMMHDFAKRLQAQKEQSPATFKKFECFCVLDLDKLTTSQLSRRALAIIKEQAAIDSICFPETMAKMLIVNAPTFFAATWRIIKGWLDPRTAGKIEVISSRSTMEKRLLEFVDADQLPSDYGGRGPTTKELLNGESSDHLETKMLYLRGHGSDSFEVGPGDSVEISVYTRSTSGATFSIVDADSKQPYVEGIKVVSPSEDEKSVVLLTEKAITGPAKLKIKGDSLGSRFSSHNFMLVFTTKK